MAVFTIAANVNGVEEDVREFKRGIPSDGQAIAKKVGRNEPCPCGSGKKYKKCCIE